MGRTSDNFPSKTLNKFKHETPQGMKYAPDTLYEQRRKLSICFKYRDKYMLNHKCNVKGLYMIKEKKEEMEESLDVKEENISDEHNWP